MVSTDHQKRAMADEDMDVAEPPLKKLREDVDGDGEATAAPQLEATEPVALGFGSRDVKHHDDGTRQFVLQNRTSERRTHILGTLEVGDKGTEFRLRLYQPAGGWKRK